MTTEPDASVSPRIAGAAAVPVTECVILELLLLAACYACQGRAEDGISALVGELTS